jgi:hypothetical protein
MEKVIQAAIRHKSGKIGLGPTHSDAMDDLLRKGVVKGLRSEEDLYNLGLRSNDDYNAVWKACEIGFITDKKRFVDRDEASRISGIEDVHGEDIREQAQQVVACLIGEARPKWSSVVWRGRKVRKSPGFDSQHLAAKWADEQRGDFHPKHWVKSTLLKNGLLHQIRGQARGTRKIGSGRRVAK